MKKFDIKRKEITGKLADHILENGIKEASLRKIAKSLNTSDRMLLHYFKDKEDLISCALKEISDKFIYLLEINPIEPKPLNEIIPYFASAIKDERVRPYINIWLELITLAKQNEEPYYSIARDIGKTFYSRIKSGILAENEEQLEITASLVFAIIEGFTLMDILGFDNLIDNSLNKIQSINDYTAER